MSNCKSFLLKVAHADLELQKYAQGEDKLIGSFIVRQTSTLTVQVSLEE